MEQDRNVARNTRHAAALSRDHHRETLSTYDQFTHPAPRSTRMYGLTGGTPGRIRVQRPPPLDMAHNALRGTPVCVRLVDARGFPILNLNTEQDIENTRTLFNDYDTKKSSGKELREETQNNVARATSYKRPKIPTQMILPGTGQTVDF